MQNSISILPYTAHVLWKTLMAIAFHQCEKWTCIKRHLLWKPARSSARAPHPSPKRSSEATKRHLNRLWRTKRWNFEIRTSVTLPAFQWAFHQKHPQISWQNAGHFVQCAPALRISCPQKQSVQITNKHKLFYKQQPLLRYSLPRRLPLHLSCFRPFYGEESCQFTMEQESLSRLAVVFGRESWVNNYFKYANVITYRPAPTSSQAVIKGPF